MARKPNPADDPRYHYEIYNGPGTAFATSRKAIWYVENHNGQCSYSELAFDFKEAADLLIKEYERTDLGNWVAPVSHLVRQTLELSLKALLEAVILHDAKVSTKPLGGHGLESLWASARAWLQDHGYGILSDARLKAADELIEAFHAVDPSGDLFRFGMSYRTAFGKSKSYDRVGLDLPILRAQFEATTGLLRHWEAVLFRQIIAKELGWTEDPYFDAEDYPRVK